jgi:metal-dependent HD superfamily phosphatase/phosphodiesterase
MNQLTIIFIFATRKKDLIIQFSLKMKKSITFQEIKNSKEIKTYIKQADASLKALGYTEHNLAHCTKCTEVAGKLLKDLGYNDHEVELAKIAGYMHDIGNVVNRVDHAQSGAIMAFRLLDKIGMDPEDTAKIITAIGNHDEGTAFPVNEVAAALIIADKTDVRRSRVRNRATIKDDIHDRVNYAVKSSEIVLNPKTKNLTLVLTIDTKICAVMDYFEIFLSRMLLCRKAADVFGLHFKLNINDVSLL